MSESSHQTFQPERIEPGRFRKLGNICLSVGVIGVVGAVAYALCNVRQFAFSWLFACVVAFTICAGALFWILVHHAMDTEWTVVIRRILENVAGLFPYLAFAFIPFLFPGVAHKIWKWMTIDAGIDVLRDHKAPYLNSPFFYARMIFYFTYFGIAATIFKKLSLGQDKDGNPYNLLAMRKFSYAAIPLLGVCLTFAAFDWLMGLDYHWFSTMWGVYIFAGSALSSMALLILVSNGLQKAGYLKVMTVEHNHIMGKLMFAFTVFWAYIAFSQYFLIYYANLPEETEFFMDRNMGQWHYYSIGLVIFHFIVPFLWLITQPAKRTTWRICAGAGFILLVHVLDIYWIIMPAKQMLDGTLTEHATISPSFADILAFVGIVGILASIFLKKFVEHPIFPYREPRLVESVNLKN